MSTMWVAGPRGDGSARAPLREIVGYRVIARDGPIGSLAWVDADAAGVPTRLAVRSGLFSPRIVLVPVRALLAVVPRRRRLFVDWRRRCE